MAETIEVVQQRSHATFAGLSARERNSVLTNVALRARSPEERRRALYRRALYAFADSRPAAPPAPVASARVARALEQPAVRGLAPAAVLARPPQPTHARTDAKLPAGCVRARPARPNVVCADVGEVPPARAKPPKKRKPRRPACLGVGPRSAPTPVCALDVDWRRLADPYKAGWPRTAAATRAAIDEPWPLARREAGRPARVPAADAKRVDALLAQIAAAEQWECSSLARAGRAPLVAPIQGFVAARAVAPPEGTPVLKDKAPPKSKAKPAPKAKGGAAAEAPAPAADLLGAADWPALVGAAPRSATELLAAGARPLVRAALAYGASSSEFAAASAAHAARRATQRAQAAARHAEAVRRRRLRGLRSALARLDPALYAKSAGAADAAALEAALPAALWKQLAAQEAAEAAQRAEAAATEDPALAAAREQLRAAYRAPRPEARRAAFRDLTALLEPGPEKITARQLREGTARGAPVLCPHAWRLLRVENFPELARRGGQDGGPEAVRAAMVPFVTQEARPSLGTDADAIKPIHPQIARLLAGAGVRFDGGGGTALRPGDAVCRVCGEIIPVGEDETLVPDRLSRATMQDTDADAVRRELRMAAGHLRSPAGRVSAQAFVEAGEGVVGRLYARAQAEIRRDRAASAGALKARAAAALGIYVHAFLAAIALASDRISLEGADDKRGNARARAPAVLTAALRLYARRYAERVVSVAAAEERPAAEVAAEAREPPGDEPMDVDAPAAKPTAKPKSKGGAEPRRAGAAAAAALKGRFLEAFRAVGELRGGLAPISARAHFLGGVMLSPVFHLLRTERRAAAVPAEKSTRAELFAPAAGTGEAAIAAHFRAVVGAPVEDFLPAGNRRPKRRFPGDIDLAFPGAPGLTPARGALWARVIYPARGGAWDAAEVAAIAARAEKEGVGGAQIALARAPAARPALPDLPPVPARPVLGAQGAARGKRWAFTLPPTTAARLAATAAGAFTPEGLPRSYMHARYGATHVGGLGSKAAVDWAKISPEAYLRGRAADATGRVLGAPATPAESAAALAAFIARTRQRSFFLRFTNQCPAPASGAHEFRGTAPAPDACRKCGVRRELIEAALGSLAGGRALAPAALAYSRKYAQDAAAKAPEAAGLVPPAALALRAAAAARAASKKALAGDAAARKALAAYQYNPAPVARLAAALGVPAGRLLLLGAFAGHSADEVAVAESPSERKRGDGTDAARPDTSAAPPAWQATVLRNGAYTLARRWEDLRRAGTAALPPAWLEAALAGALPRARWGALAALAPAAPGAAENAARQVARPTALGPAPLQGYDAAFALAAAALPAAALRGWALEALAGGALRMLEAPASPKTPKPVRTALARAALGAVRHVFAQLVAAERLTLRIGAGGAAVDRLGRAGVADRGAAPDGTAILEDDGSAARGENGPAGADVATPEQRHWGDSDYNGENEENSELPDDMPESSRPEPAQSGSLGAPI